MSSILQFNGLYGDNQPSYLSDFIHFEPLEFRSKIYSWEINQHVHTKLFQMFIIKSGDGYLVSGKNRITIKAPCIITIPASIMHGFSLESNIKGDVLTFSDSYYENILKEYPQLCLKLNKLNLVSFIKDIERFGNLLYVVKNISKEILNNAKERQLALKSYFQLLFLELYRKSLMVENIELQTTNRTLIYFQQFQKLIKQSLNKPLSIKDYASKLGITQMHLNRVCHAVVEESALKVVQSFMVNEAKKYLLNTSYSISEIAYFLDFNDPAYFNRVFKKLVGVPPGEFRNS